MAKKRPPYNQESAIRGALRRAFSRSPIVKEVMDESRREVPRYNKDGSRHKKNWVQAQCQVCNQWSSKSKMAVDHIIPVISVEHGKKDWNEFIDRLWCAKENLQRICHVCHDKKTYMERIERLLKLYTKELDTLEGVVNSDWVAYQIQPAVLLKSLGKYTAKKKTIGLEKIVERALKLKDQVKTKRGK